MPKQKTHKTSIKRFKITGSGKIMRVRSAGNHLLTNKSDRKIGRVEVSRADRKRVKKLITRG